MVYIKNISIVLCGVTAGLAMKYVEQQFPNMNLIQLTQIDENEFQIILTGEIGGINNVKQNSI